MKLEVTRVDIWIVGIKDRPGGLVEKLEPLAQASANLEFLLARRSPEKPGRGVVFVTPVRGAAQEKAAKQAGFKKAKSLCGLRVACVDKPGLAVKLVRLISDAGINLRGLSGAAIGKRAIFHLAFDSVADANKAARCLKQI
ncbi:MAG: ACT domain-containing protein [Sedimentisphaerales bacterium]